MLGIFTSVLMPFIVLQNYIYVEPVMAEPNFYVYETVSSQPIESSFDWMKLLYFTYYSGVIFFFIKWLISFSSLIVILKNNTIQKVGSYYMMKTDKETAPFSFFKWIAYNPTQFTADELQLIINHEKVHAKEWHSIDIIVSQLLTILFWFNPIMWLYKKELQQNLEFIADQKAQETSSSHINYQKLLLKTSLPHQQLAITNNFYNSLIKKRIVMLHKSNILNTWKYALILPALVIFMMSFNTKDVFIEKPSTSTSEGINTIDENSAVIPTLSKDLTITKDMTDADLETLKNALKEKGFDATFKNIKRNSKGEIMSIKVEISSENSNANYGVSGDKPIQPITINIGNDSIGISSVTAKADKQVVYIQSDDTDDDDKSVIKSVYVNGNAISADTIVIKKDFKKMIFTDEKGKKINIIASENGNINPYDIPNNVEIPLFILNGNVISQTVMNEIDPNVIESVTVLKNKNATDKYGDEGKNGVIEIRSGNSPNKISYAVGKVNYTDNFDAAKNATLFYTTKNTKDTEIDVHKAELKNLGITANYSKIKRDKSGKIVSIKISLNDNNGQKASATYEDSDGISDIRYGIIEGKLVLQSTK